MFWRGADRSGCEVSIGEDRQRSREPKEPPGRPDRIPARALRGGAGSDTLQDGSVEDDVFDGGTGDDIIISADAGGSTNGGGSGNDTFIYRRGDGNDRYFDGTFQATETDRLVLVDIAATEVELSRAGDHLLITDIVTGQTITNESFFFGWYPWSSTPPGQGIDEIEFNDGTIWDRDDLREHAWIRGTNAREVLRSGEEWDDTFVGGKGADTIVSTGVIDAQGSGNDTFIYRHGDGNDTYYDGTWSSDETDKLILQDIETGEVELSRVGDNLVIKDLVTGHKITNQYFFSGWFIYNAESMGRGIDEVQFADGTLWDRFDLLGKAWIRGTNTRDRLQEGGEWDDTFNAGRGDDLIVSAVHYTTTYGLSSTGSDTFIYRRGDGNDTYFDSSWSSDEADRLILQDINAGEVELSRAGDNLLIKDLVTGQQITNESFFFSMGGTSIDEIQFADGTAWNRETLRYWGEEGSIFYAGKNSAETLIGSFRDQRISGAGGDDFIDGKAGSDLLFGDQGNDTLSISVVNAGELDALDGGEGNDTATFAEFSAAVRVDLVANRGEAETADQGSVSSGTLRTIATLAAIENVVGTAFHDVISGDAGNNLLFGGNGNDELNGRSGDDELNGDAGSDALDGYLGNDRLTGGAGSDALTGGLGNDTYVYARGDGTDTVEEGAGDFGDRLLLTGVDPSAVTLERDGDDIRLLIAESATGAGDAGAVLLKDSVDASDGRGIDEVRFSDGTVWTRAQIQSMLPPPPAGTGDETIVGTDASEILAGRDGNDTLDGAGGDDTYLWAYGDGHDTITEGRYSGSQDTLTLEGIAPSAVTLIRSGNSGNNVKVVIAESAPGAGDGGSVLLKDSLNDDWGSPGVEKVTFANGTVWTRADLRSKLLANSAADETFIGFWNDDTFHYARGSGHDTIVESRYEGGNDQLVFDDINADAVTLIRSGSSNNDVKLVVAESTPGAGDGGSIVLRDSLNDDWGSPGVEKVTFANGAVWTRADLRSKLLANTAADQTFTGFWNDDTFRYARGNGHDTIVEARHEGGNDQLDFDDINPGSITLIRTGSSNNDVKLVIAESVPGAGDGGSVLLKDSLNDDYGSPGVEKVTFANGTVWTRADLRNKLLANTAADETFVGFWNDDAFHYARGNGNDTIIEARHEGSNDQLVFDDINPDAVTLIRTGSSNNDVKLLITESVSGAGDGGSILLKESFSDDYGSPGVEKVIFANGTIWTRADFLDLV